MPKPGRTPSLNGDEDEDDGPLKISMDVEYLAMFEVLAKRYRCSVPELVFSALVEYFTSRQ